MKITDILEKLQELAANTADKGALFERFVMQYLRATRIYGEFKEIWRWSDWPLNQEQHDTGIDLVALTESGEYWAFQCKFFDPASKVSKHDIDSFLSASAVNFTDEEGGTHTFSARYVVATCEIGQNAYQTMNAQTIPANFISAKQFDLSGINWDIFWDQFTEQVSGSAEDARIAPKELRPHQQNAFNDVLHGFETCARGKLIMACGTGKTFTSLRIAEGIVPDGGVMLYLVPSLSLLGQTLCAWSIDAKRTIRPVLVCSDTAINEQDARRKKALKNAEDHSDLSVSDLAQPASTDPDAIMKRWERLRAKKEGFTVVFSTYQSIQAVSDAQKKGFPEFDLIICDEAHRTTGAALAETDDVSAFMRVHNNANVAGKKRLYMTATPRVYGEKAQKSAKDQTDGAVVIASMDDESIYGPVFHMLKFGDAVNQGLLADYKVVILTVRESLANEYRKQITDETRTTYRKTYPKLKKADDDEIDEVILSDFAKVIGCWQGLAKQAGSIDAQGKTSFDFSADPAPMRRAVAFAQSINISKNIVTDLFRSVSEFVEELQNKKRAEDPSFSEPRLQMNLEHVDGTNTANERKKKLDWLAAEPEEETCRILTNVRCLSEGVDVPALDAVLFLSPRNSKVDIIQSVGRVMRNAPGKNFGYIILPIAIPEYADPETILNKNERFKVVWEVLQALRSHDERLKIEINKIRFNDMNSGDTYDPNDPSKGTVGTGGAPDSSEEEADVNIPQSSAESYQFRILFGGMEEMKDRIRAKVVQKCGDRDYLDESAKIIAEIAKIHIDQIRAQLDELDPERKAAFDEFAARLRQDLNPSIDTEQVFDMISQHLVTQPVFDALFGDYPFAKKNVVSQAFERLLSIFKTQSSEEEWNALERVREDIRSRVEGITSLSGKQQVIYKIYEQFFKVAAKKTAEKLGIVYTPVEVVDFIIHSVEYILKTEFGKSMSNRNVHILDPFTGTGTFIVRLLESGILDPDSPNFAYKFNNELHANELVLLAYYIAAINIEQTFFSVGMRKKYQSFPGLLLTDTFQTGEKELPAEQNENSLTFPKNVIGEEDIEHFENDKRIIRQRRQTIQVILGNPPYSVGQGSANDNNQNQKYPILDARIEETYAAWGTAALKRNLYDSYIKAFRWASDRIGESGVIGFVTNGGWLDGNSQDGLRKCFANEFSSIYVFNLRGNQRTSGELSRKEGGKIFGSGSRTPVAITILVKNPQKAGKPCEIFYHDIGDYLKREDKLRIVHDFHDISFISFQTITPNAEGDWLDQRSTEFESFIELGNKGTRKEGRKEGRKEDSCTIFAAYSLGVVTSRDAWCYNFSKDAVWENIQNSIRFYNQQVDDYAIVRQERNVEVEDFIDTDSTKFSWDRAQRFDIAKGKKYTFNPDSVRLSIYRPFCKQTVYFNREMNNCVYQIPKLFPTPEHKNLVICVEAPGTNKDFSCLITDMIPDLHVLSASQCFPLYWYEKSSSEQVNMFSEAEDGYIRHDGVTDGILERFRAHCMDETIGKEDIFYFVYGYLHDPNYRTKFAADLKKMLPRLPLVGRSEFWAYSKAGRQLADLHLNYETQAPLSEIFVDIRGDNFRVEKMFFLNKELKDTIIVNPHIAVRNIPQIAYEYVVNGKSAIEWVMDRYRVVKDKDSGILNDPNEYSADPQYILKLLLSVITVSVKTVQILRSAPYVREE